MKNKNSRTTDMRGMARGTCDSTCPQIGRASLLRVNEMLDHVREAI
ncbi:MAG: hypothetical protein V5783_12635 [Pontiella sp.]